MDDRIRARELLAVGYFFEAQQATQAGRRDDLVESARKQFLALLRERPDYELDKFVFPASVVELFEEVREAHADELERLRREASQTNRRSDESNTLYIERKVVRRQPALNLLPFGIGQFQNGQSSKGYAIAGIQVAALAVQATGSAVIWSVRDPRSGLIPAEDFPTARAWRIAQIAAGATFGATYAISVADGFANFEPRSVHIRTRDNPPPELDDSSSSGLRPLFRIGLGGVSIRW